MKVIEIEKELSLHGVVDIIELSMQDHFTYQQEMDGMRCVGPFYVNGRYSTLNEVKDFQEIYEFDVFAGEDKLDGTPFRIEYDGYDYSILKQVTLYLHFKVHGIKGEQPATIEEEIEIGEAPVEEVTMGKGNAWKKSLAEAMGVDASEMVQEDITLRVQEEAVEASNAAFMDVNNNPWQSTLAEALSRDEKDVPYATAMQAQEAGIDMYAQGTRAAFQDENGDAWQSTLAEAFSIVPEEEVEEIQTSQPEEIEEAQPVMEEIPTPVAEEVVEPIQQQKVITPTPKAKETVLVSQPEEVVEEPVSINDVADISMMEELFDDKDNVITSYSFVVIKPGDSYASIARRYHIEEESLRKANNDKELLPKNLLVMPYTK